MYREVTDEQTLLKYWKEEHHFPQWFVEANDVWIMTEENFLAFCRKCWKIYEVNKCALLYVDKDGANAEVHFSILRGSDIKPLMPVLKIVRSILMEQCEMLFGWTVRQNRGIQRVCQAMGMEFNGVKMLHGQCHDKVIEWKCYSLTKEKFLVVEN